MFRETALHILKHLLEQEVNNIQSLQSYALRDERFF